MYTDLEACVQLLNVRLEADGPGVIMASRRGVIIELVSIFASDSLSPVQNVVLCRGRACSKLSIVLEALLCTRGAPRPAAGAEETPFAEEQAVILLSRGARMFHFDALGQAQAFLCTLTSHTRPLTSRCMGSVSSRTCSRGTLEGSCQLLASWLSSWKTLIILHPTQPVSWKRYQNRAISYTSRADLGSEGVSCYAVTALGREHTMSCGKRDGTILAAIRLQSALTMLRAGEAQHGCCRLSSVICTLSQRLSGATLR